jgi:hypothetical protein
MNDVRDSVDRIAERFDPPRGGLEDLSRRKSRTRVRRRIVAGALAVAVAAGGSLLVVGSFSGSEPRTHSRVEVLATWAAASTPAPAQASSPATCPAPSGDSPPPVALSSTSGAAGSSIDVTGTFASSELLWMQLLWNAGELDGDIAPPPWPRTGPDLPFAPAGPGPVVKLAAIAGPATTGECSFHTSFTVPDAEPGTYQLRWFFGGLGHSTEPSHPRNVYALYASGLTFQVTA